MSEFLQLSLFAFEAVFVLQLLRSLTRGHKKMESGIYAISGAFDKALHALTTYRRLEEPVFQVLKKLAFLGYPCHEHGPAIKKIFGQLNLLYGEQSSFIYCVVRRTSVIVVGGLVLRLILAVNGKSGEMIPWPIEVMLSLGIVGMLYVLIVFLKARVAPGLNDKTMLVWLPAYIAAGAYRIDTEHELAPIMKQWRRSAQLNAETQSDAFVRHVAELWFLEKIRLDETRLQTLVDSQPLLELGVFSCVCLGWLVCPAIELFL
jgi:hypothetical protein